MNSVARSALARVASFVPTAAATLLTSRIIIDHFGIRAFDSFALILALINLVPLNDFGVGAAVTVAYAENDPDSSRAQRTVLTAARVLALSALGTAALAILVGAAGLWPVLLGAASGPNFWCASAMVIYALTFLPGLAPSVLLGVNRNHLTILLQTFFNPLIACLTALAVLAGLSGNSVMVIPCVALLVIHAVTSIVASRVTKLSWSSVLRQLPYRQRFPGASIRSMSGPVLVITMATPIALQSDRIVLSHVSNTQAVANYSIAFQIFAPALVLIAASAQPLWPMYTQARTEGRRGPDIIRTILWFGGASFGIATVLGLLAGPAAHLIGGPHVHVSPLLALAGALVVVTAGLSYPVAMSLMDESGIRFVLWCTIIALPLNVGLSIVLGKQLGAPGPLLASFGVGLLVQAVPGILYSRDRQHAGRHRQTRRPPAPLRPIEALPVALERSAD